MQQFFPMVAKFFFLCRKISGGGGGVATKQLAAAAATRWQRRRGGRSLELRSQHATLGCGLHLPLDPESEPTGRDAGAESRRLAARSLGRARAMGAVVGEEGRGRREAGVLVEEAAEKASGGQRVRARR